MDVSKRLFTPREFSSPMSFVSKRALSTLIPPKVASAKNLGSAPNAKRMGRVVEFYKSLPQGPAPKVEPKSFTDRYIVNNFGAGSGRPLLHVIGALLLCGYTADYYFHLRHHKDH